MVEYLTGSPFVDDIVEEKWKLGEDGMLNIPEAPELGISLTPEKFARYTGGARRLQG